MLVGQKALAMDKKSSFGKNDEGPPTASQNEGGESMKINNLRFEGVYNQSITFNIRRSRYLATNYNILNVMFKKVVQF